MKTTSGSAQWLKTRGLGFTHMFMALNFLDAEIRRGLSVGFQSLTTS